MQRLLKRRFTARAIVRATCLAAFLPTAGYAATVTWNFNSLTEGTASTSDAYGGAVSAYNGTIAFNSTSASSGYSGASTGTNASVSAASGPLALGTSGSTAFQFTINPIDQTLDFSQVKFGSRSTATGPLNVAVYYSLDGFATAGTPFGTAASTLANSTWALQTINASTFSSSTPVTFRIFGFAGSGTGSGNWRIDDLAVTYAVGAAASPIPSLSIAPAVTRALVNTNVALSGNVGTTAAAFNGWTLSSTSGKDLTVSSFSPGTGNTAVGTPTAYTAQVATGSAPGTKTFGATVTAGAATANAAGTLTVVEKRVVTAAPVDLGRRLDTTNLSTISTTTGFSTTGSQDVATTIGVNGHVFNSTETATLAVMGTSGTIAASGTLASYPVTGEGLAGEGSYANVNVAYTATPVVLRTVIEPNVLALGNILSGANVRLAFASTNYKFGAGGTGAFADTETATVGVDGSTQHGLKLSGADYLTDTTTNVNSAAGVVKTLTGAITGQGVVNGSFSVPVTREFSGAQTLTYAFTANVGGASVGAGGTFGAPSNAPVSAGQPYGNLSLTGNGQHATTASIVAGTNTAGGAETIAMAMRNATAADASTFFSDIVSITGMNGATAGVTDVFALQLSYDQTAVDAAGIDEARLQIAWRNGASWVAGVSGNSPTSNTAGYLGGFAAFVAEKHVTEANLGDFLARTASIPWGTPPGRSSTTTANSPSISARPRCRNPRHGSRDRLSRWDSR
ncbi:MAG: hypothetical protein QM811_09610 [Pirellulales bacterium]